MGGTLPGQSIPVASVCVQLVDFFFNWTAGIVVLSMFPALSSAPHSKMFIPRALEKPRDEIFYANDKASSSFHSGQGLITCDFYSSICRCNR